MEGAAPAVRIRLESGGGQRAQGIVTSTLLHAPLCKLAQQPDLGSGVSGFDSLAGYAPVRQRRAVALKTRRLWVRIPPGTRLSRQTGKAACLKSRCLWVQLPPELLVQLVHAMDPCQQASDKDRQAEHYEQQQYQPAVRQAAPSSLLRYCLPALSMAFHPASIWCVVGLSRAISLAPSSAARCSASSRL